MKPALLLWSVSLCILVACNNETKPDAGASGEEVTSKTSVSSPDLTEAADAYQKRADELQKLAPYTLDQMKAMLPEEIAGAKLSKSSANSAIGAAYAEGEYPINDSTFLELKIFDCAGQAGSGIYSTQYLGMMNFESETDNEYTKTISFMGGKAVEQLDKKNNHSTLTYLASNRLLVTLEGRNTGLELLKQTAAGLALK